MCESGDPWRQMIRKILDKDKWERYRRAVWDIDSEDTDSEGNDSEDTIESLGGEQKVDVKKTVSFKKFYSVIRGDMGLTDRRRQANYGRADTMFLRCKDGFQSLRGHAVHEGIMELDPVELRIWNGHVRCQSVEWIYSTKFGLVRQEFDPLQYRPTHNKLKKIGKKLQEHVQRQWARSRIRHWQTVTRYLGLGAHLISMQKPVWDTDNMCFQIPKMQLGDVDVTDPGLDVIVQRSRSRWNRRCRASQAPTWREIAAMMERAGRRRRQRRQQRRRRHRSRPTEEADNKKNKKRQCRKQLGIDRGGGRRRGRRTVKWRTPSSTP